MKLGIFAVLMAMFIGQAFAEEVRHLNVYKDTALISHHHSKIKMSDVRFEMVPKVIRIVPAPCHSDLSDCTRAQVLETEAVVQVKVEYRDGLFREENSYRTSDMTFNLPTDAFSTEELATLKAASRIGLTSRNRNVRKQFLNDKLQMEVTEVLKPTVVIDEATSELCEVDHVWERRPGCVIVRNYRNETMKYKQIKISVK